MFIRAHSETWGNAPTLTDGMNRSKHRTGVLSREQAPATSNTEAAEVDEDEIIAYEPLLPRTHRVPTTCEVLVSDRYLNNATNNYIDAWSP